MQFERACSTPAHVRPLIRGAEGAPQPLLKLVEQALIEEPQNIGHVIMRDLGEIKGNQKALEAKMDAHRAATEERMRTMEGRMSGVEARLGTLESAKTRAEGQIDGGARVAGWLKWSLGGAIGWLVAKASAFLHAVNGG